MIYSVNDAEMAARVNPFALAKYALETGWTEVRVRKENIRVFQKEDGADFHEIILPTDRRLSDFSMAMSRCVQELADAEHKSARQVLLYLLNPDSDILKVRLERTDLSAGDILIDDAVALYESTKKLLLSAAQDVFNPAVSHLGRPDTRAAEFVSSCRFGQTEIGSYVISVICPFDTSERDGYQEQALFADAQSQEIPLARTVTARIMNNVSLIRDKISASREEELLAGSAAISSNFYDALIGLGIASEQASVEIRADWSPSYRQQSGVSAPVRLTHDYYAPILSLSHKLKGTVKEDKIIVGRVVQLNSNQEAEKRTEGIAKIAYADEEGKAHKMDIVLNNADYEKAIDAHRDGYYIRAAVRGSTAGRRVKCENFSVIE